MPAEQPLFNLKVTSEFHPARGPKLLPENVRIFLGYLTGPEEITTGWDNLTLDIALERRDQAKKEPDTKRVEIFLAE